MKYFLQNCPAACGAMILAFGLAACQTLEKPEPGKPPVIEADMDLEEMIDIAVGFGGNSIEQAKKHIKERNLQKEAAKQLLVRLKSGMNAEPENVLVNTMHLYQVNTRKADISLFTKFVGADRVVARVLALNLAANLPSREIAAALDAELTRRIQEGSEEDVLVPQLASAIQANHLVSAYSFARSGLMSRGDDAFAKTMIALKPDEAGDDAMSYLALASVEDLRQLNQSAVNVFSCMVILRHLVIYPPSLNHPHFHMLFLYAVSRNKVLSDLAALVLTKLFETNQKDLAIVLSRLPDWVQVAYIDTARRGMTPDVSRFLVNLKEVTPYDHVIEEIDEAVR